MSKKKFVNPFKHVAIIPQTKQTKNEMWPAVENNMGLQENYIVVCCEPSMNGLYKWDKQSALQTGRVYLSENNRKKIYCVPIDLITYVCSLEEIKDEKLKAKITEKQNDWYNGDVENHEAGKYKKRDWYLDRN